MRVTIDIPENIAKELKRDSAIQNEEDLKVYLAAKIYESGFLSDYACGLIAGFDNRIEFMEKAGKFDVSYLNVLTAKEMAQDYKNVKEFTR
jgi:hypothetical protein